MKFLDIVSGMVPRLVNSVWVAETTSLTPHWNFSRIRRILQRLYDSIGQQIVYQKHMFIYPGVISRGSFNEWSSYNIPGGKLLQDLKLMIRGTAKILGGDLTLGGKQNTIYR